MVLFNNVLSSAFMVIVYYTSTTSAAPWPVHSKHATHRVRHVSRGLQLQTFHPMSTFEVIHFIREGGVSQLTFFVPRQTFGEGIEHPTRVQASDDLEKSSTSFVASHLGLDSKSVSYHSGYSGDVSKYAYIKQVHVRTSCDPLVILSHATAV